jgi:arsenite-transporting ATPase
MRQFLQSARRFLFFTGKGGVGKTSMACATAVALAGAGKRVLLISTDPASNLDEVLGTPLDSVPVPVQGVERLEAMNINPVAAANAYRERIVGPFRGVLPEATVKSIEEQLSGACTVEIASFNEFTRLLGHSAAIEGYDHVILDTAPTGHTLRLLSLPAAWNDFIASSKTGNSCLGPLAGLKEQRLVYERAVTALCNPEQTVLALVTRAEPAALKEAARASKELGIVGIKNQRLIINGLFTAIDRNDPIALGFEQRGREAIANLPPEIATLPRTEVPFKPQGFVGISSLANVFNGNEEPRAEQLSENSPPGANSELRNLVDQISQTSSGVIMTMGKGGVGKTTLAAAIAVELAHRGFPVHLSTTDPAAHISDAVGEVLPNLQVHRIDPAAETLAHVEHVMATTGAALDEEGRSLLEEELRSPCTEEIAVFQAFARTVAKGNESFVVLDTAPTGHTLLLLDATEAYHREVLRRASDLPEPVRELLPRLRNRDYTKVILVTLPEATPVHEAAQLQEDLRRAGIEPFAWAINQSFAAASPSDPALRAKSASETRYISEVHELAANTAIIPWIPGSLSGRENLRKILASEHEL